jgi:hypothetical protein
MNITEIFKVVIQFLKNLFTKKQMKYTIKKGSHYCNHPILTHNGTTLESRLVTITTSWKFVSGTDEYPCVHKIWGFTYGIDPHHTSARIGLKKMTDGVKLMSYVYDGGTKLKDKLICTLYWKDYDGDIKDLRTSIRYVSGKFIFSVNNFTADIDVSSKPSAGLFLFPYYGGKIVAPVNTVTFISEF